MAHDTIGDVASALALREGLALKVKLERGRFVSALVETSEAATVLEAVADTLEESLEILAAMAPDANDWHWYDTRHERE